ncbi:MAG: hypothetical protein ACI4XM_03925 [Candidatus Coprovivens sp.]
MAFNETSINKVKNIVSSMKTDVIQLAKDLEKKLQEEVIYYISEGWFAGEAVLYMKYFDEDIKAMSHEMAVDINDQISRMMYGYDKWLEKARKSEDPEEAEIANSMYKVHFSPSYDTKLTENTNMNYKYTSGADRREYSYMSSESTKIKLNLDNIRAVNHADEGDIGINSDNIVTAKENISLIKKQIEENISSYQQKYNNLAYSIDDYNLRSIIEGYTFYINKSIKKIFEYMEISANNKVCLSKKIDEIKYKYENVITGKVKNIFDE